MVRGSGRRRADPNDEARISTATRGSERQRTDQDGEGARIWSTTSGSERTTRRSGQRRAGSLRGTADLDGGALDPSVARRSERQSGVVGRRGGRAIGAGGGGGSGGVGVAAFRIWGERCGYIYGGAGSDCGAGRGAGMVGPV